MLCFVNWILLVSMQRDMYQYRSGGLAGPTFVCCHLLEFSSLHDSKHWSLIGSSLCFELCFSHSSILVGLFVRLFCCPSRLALLAWFGLVAPLDWFALFLCQRLCYCRIDWLQTLWGMNSMGNWFPCAVAASLTLLCGFFRSQCCFRPMRIFHSAYEWNSLMP
mgnify:CR=1 FL=1